MTIVIFIGLLFSIHTKDKICLYYAVAILEITLLALLKPIVFNFQYFLLSH